MYFIFVIHQRRNIRRITEDVLSISLFQICNISCMCAISLQSHYRGSKHRKVNFCHIKCVCRFNRKFRTVASSVLDFARLQVLIWLIGRYVTVINLKYSNKKTRWNLTALLCASCSLKHQPYLKVIVWYLWNQHLNDVGATGGERISPSVFRYSWLKYCSVFQAPYFE